MEPFAATFPCYQNPLWSFQPPFVVERGRLCWLLLCFIFWTVSGGGRGRAARRPRLAGEARDSVGPGRTSRATASLPGASWLRGAPDPPPSPPRELVSGTQGSWEGSRVPADQARLARAGGAGPGCWPEQGAPLPPVPVSSVPRPGVNVRLLLQVDSATAAQPGGFHAARGTGHSSPAPGLPCGDMVGTVLGRWLCRWAPRSEDVLSPS